MESQGLIFATMGLFDRWRKGNVTSTTIGRGGRRDGPDMDVDLGAVRRHSQEFIKARRGVEGYVEPATNMTTTTLVLVAHDGEWTRRAVGAPKNGFGICRDLGIPVYDVNQVGYPSRMRKWSKQQRDQKR